VFETVWLSSVLKRGLLIRKKGEIEWVMSLGDVGNSAVMGWPMEFFRDDCGAGWRLKDLESPDRFARNV
jgi:hypothetical protein